MDGMLSQDEINALLNGVDLSADSGADTATATAGGSTGEDLSDIEKDAIGEVANITADVVCESVDEDGVYFEFKRMNLI